MKLPDKIKLEVQCFAYFLFKGTLDHRLIVANFDYLDKLLANPNLVFNCFEIFVYEARLNSDAETNKKVADYILALHGVTNQSSTEIIDTAKKFNTEQPTTYWSDFLVLAKCFCFNSFPKPLNEEYLSDLNGCGSYAVPAFAVWSNVIEIDENLKPLNSEWALLRANERIKLWDEIKPSVEFADWELEQEIY
jgi:hypothetical protein